MMHDEAATLLPDYLVGRLPRRIRGKVGGHAITCADCLALVEAYRLLAAGFRAQAARDAPDHATVEELVQAALTAEEGRSGRPGFAAHLRACLSCARDLEAVKRSKAEVERNAGLGGRLDRAWRRFAALRIPRAAQIVAGMAALALAFVAYQGLYSVPRLRANVEALRAARQRAEGQVAEMSRTLVHLEAERRRLLSWTGSIAVPLIAAPLRGTPAHEITIPVAEGQPYVCLALDPGPLGAGPGAGSLRVRVVRPDGQVAWSFEMQPAGVRRQMALAGSLAFLVPSEALPPGRYLFTTAWRLGDRERQLFDVPISVLGEE